MIGKLTVRLELSSDGSLYLNLISVRLAEVLSGGGGGSNNNRKPGFLQLQIINRPNAPAPPNCNQWLYKYMGSNGMRRRK